MTRIQTTILKVLLAGAMILGAASVWGMWFFSAELAEEYPEFAFLRWPYLCVWLAFAVCCEAILVSIWALVQKVERSAIFDSHSFVWVNIIVRAAYGLVAVMVAALIPDVAVTHGPPGLSLLLLVGIAASAGFALLMVVMRHLLQQATGLKSELDEVI